MLTDIERKNIIQGIVEAEPEPDQTLCPTMILYYRRVKNGVKKLVEKNVNTGEVSDTPKYTSLQYGSWTQFTQFNRDNVKDNVILRSPCKYILSEYAKTHKIEGHKIIELAIIEIEGRLKNNDGKWHFNNHLYYSWYNHRYFIFDDSTRVFMEDGNEFMPESMNKYYNEYFAKNVIRYFYASENNTRANEERFKFTNNRDRNENLKETNMWTFIDWYKHFGHAIAGCGGKSKETLTAEEIIKKVSNINIKEICKSYPLTMKEYDNLPDWYSNSYYTKNQNLVIFDVIDGWGVFRVIHRFPKYIYDTEWGERALNYLTKKYPLLRIEEENPVETNRLLISPNGKAITFGNSADTWVRTTRTSRNFFGWWDRTATIVGTEKFEEIDHLKYLKPLFNEENGIESIKTIINCLRYPVIEQMSKMGLNALVKEICMDGCIPSSFHQCFGVKPRKGSLTKITGMTSAQLIKLNKMVEDNKENNTRYNNSFRIFKWLVRSVKLITGVKNLSDLSKEDTDKYFPLVEALVNETSGGWKSDLLHDMDNIPYNRYRYYHNYNELEDSTTLTEEERNRIKRILKICGTDPTNYTLYTDTFRSYAQLYVEDRPRIDLYDISDLEHLRIVHDNLAALVNHQLAMSYEERNKREMKLYKDRYEKLKKKFFFEDDEFSIAPPASAAELITEGSNLHHCVGGYVSKIATGETNILFLRKKESPNTSFYTIEVRNDGVLQQIHGLQNCWLGNNPEAIPFVLKWLRTKGISFTKEKILSVAKGYCNTGGMLNGARFGL